MISKDQASRLLQQWISPQGRVGSSPTSGTSFSAVIYVDRD